MTDRALTLSPEYCRERQQRLWNLLDERSIGQAVLTTTESVQYFTGFRPHRLMSAAVGFAAGECTLVTPNAVPEHVAADHVVPFDAQRLATLRQDQVEASVRRLAEAVDFRSEALGVEFSSAGLWAARVVGIEQTGRLIDLDADLWHLRRAKFPDELAMIGRAIDCTNAMYAAAREIIRPGVTELDVFNRLQAAAVEVADEPLTALGNDFRSNAPGGSPRPRPVEAGELMILDLGPCYRGYYADNCRTFAVDGQPTDEQQAAWQQVVAVLEMVERTVKPGVSAKEVYGEARRMLDGYQRGAFSHHLGHGFGLDPHEAPHLNPHWDDSFEVGDVFTAEPGVYAEALKAGIRLEQNYLVTAQGVERLTTFPLDL